MTSSHKTPEGGQPQTMSLEQAIVLAYDHWNAGQAPQSEQLCQQILKVWPEHPDALHLLGLLSFTQGNRELAIDYVRRACATPRAPATYYANLAEMCRQAGRLEEAETAGRRAVALDAELVAAWINLGIVLQEAGKLEESLTCLLWVIGRAPDSPENRNNLANTYKRLGRFNEARREYQAAIELRPSYSEARSNYANLLSDLGECAAAAAEARQAIEINPHNVDAYINAAGIAIAQGNPAEALRWLDNLANFAPTHPGGLVARAKAMKDGERAGEALEAARRAAAAVPENAEAQEILAQCLGNMGLAKEALDVFDKAIALPQPQPERPLVSKGVLLAEIGRSAEATACFEKALSINPLSIGALFNIANAKTLGRNAPEIETMERLLLKGGVEGLIDRITLHFGLGKAWLDAGDDDRAFQHYAEGNRLKRASFTYDPDETDRWIESIIRVVTPDVVGRLAGKGDPSSIPVFVCGVPRTGTTLVEQILASHPQVFGAGELRIMQGMVDRIFGPDGRPLGFPDFVGSMVGEDAARLGREYVERILPLAPARARIVDKMPSNFLFAGLIHAILPNARIINCVRDPIDTGLSCYTRLFMGDQRFAYDLREFGRFQKNHDAIMAHWNTVIPADRLMEVRYETVVGDLEGEARRLIDFVGLEWDNACLDFHKTARQIRTASLNQVRQPIYSNRVRAWKRHVRHLEPLLDELGVAPSERA